MNRTDIINAAIRTFGYRTYLEIGVRNPADNFDRVECEHKQGVDVSDMRRPGIAHCTSQEFFAERPEPWHRWACIFIDADHSEPGVQHDVDRALEHLAPGGCIVMHDCRPLSKAAVVPRKPSNGLPWNGQAWRVFLRLRGRDDLTAVCVDADHGVGLVWRSRGLPGYRTLPARDVTAGQDFATYLPRRAELLELTPPADLQTFLNSVARAAA